MSAVNIEPQAATLLPDHQAMLDASGISGDVARERGYFSATKKVELKELGFSQSQWHVPALVIPIHDTHGTIRTYVVRPDKPRIDKHNKPVKYEIPRGTTMLLDIPPRVRAFLGNPAITLFVTEGLKKADAGASIGLCCIDVIGVWNFRGTNEHGGKVTLPDWDDIALNGRLVYIVYDSDVMTKPGVHAALARLMGVLKHRDATVLLIYLPAKPDGGKMGLDDYLATGATVDDLLALATPILRGLPTTNQSVASVFPDGDGADLAVPEGYALDDCGTYVVREDDDGNELRERVAHRPIIITRRARDVDDGTFALHLADRRQGVWQETVTDRATAMNSRSLPDLAATGFCVSSENARSIVRYLQAFEAANEATLPTELITSHLGWQGDDGRLGYLAGRELIGQDASSITFRGKDVGDEQAVRAFHQAGTLEDWLDTVALLARYPKALLAFYASFVPPLLDILDCPNFAVDIAGRTSVGKTTTLRVAASVWGQPDEMRPDSVVATFDTTNVGIERRAALLTGLPLIVDESQRAKNPELLAKLIYLIASGQTRTRGTTRGLAATRPFRTVMLTSGEAPITSFGQEGGTRTRVLSLRGMPFGVQDDGTARLINTLLANIKVNFGHAGPAFVRHLIEHHKDWEMWKSEYRQTARSLAGSARNPEAVRLADYAAAIDQAAVIAHEALGLPWDWNAPLQTIWEMIAGESADASGEGRALADVYSWAVSNQARFHGRLDTDDRGNERIPVAGIAGRWEPGAAWPFLAFHPPVLKRVLADMGYNPDAILAGWRENGWLDVRGDGKKGFTKHVRVSGEIAHMVVLRGDAIHSQGGDDE